jgi:ribonuclease Z
VTPLFHPQLVNDRFGDPALYIEFLFERRALMFDIGDIHPLASRKLLRVRDVFVSHTHMDHFSGLDQLLRVILGRGARLRLYGPTGFLDRVENKLGAYTWNVVQNYAADLVLTATEVRSESEAVAAEFHLWEAFRRRDLGPVPIDNGILLDEEGFRIRTTVLDHHTPCLAFALEEKRHVNVYKNEVEAMGFRVGPWLRELRHAVLRDEPDDTPFVVRWRDGGREHQRRVPLGELKPRLLRIVPGQKIAYVVDAVFHEANARRIVALARDADLLFIEAAFLEAEAEVAARKHHLTARQAGELARRAQAREMVPFHFSTRYAGRDGELEEEARAAFTAPA